MKKINLARLILIVVCIVAILSVTTAVIILSLGGDDDGNQDGGNQQDVTYTVTFDLKGGGDGNDSAFASQSVKGGECAVKPSKDPTREGYDFDGWNFDFTTPITASRTVEAKWKAGTIPADLEFFTVSFNLDGADNAGDSVFTNQRVEKGNFAQEPSKEPSKEGYAFKGWYFDEAEFDFETTPVNEDTELTAKFVKLYKVTFYVDSEVYEIQDVEDGQRAVKPVNPEKDGYIYTEWFLFGYGTMFDFDTIINADLELSAGCPELLEEYFEVSFDLDGGAQEYCDYLGIFDTQVVAYGDYAKNPLIIACELLGDYIILLKSGLEFKGWYLDGIFFDFTNDKVTKSMTLLASWGEYDGDFEFEFLDGVHEGEYKLVKYLGAGSIVYVPAFFNGYPVTIIGEGAFEGADYVGYATLPKSVKIIEENAFKNSGLIWINLENAEEIGESAFENCVNLSCVNLSSVLELHIGAFIDCVNLIEIIMERGDKIFENWLIHLGGANYYLDNDADFIQGLVEGEFFNWIGDKYNKYTIEPQWMNND